MVLTNFLDSSFLRNVYDIWSTDTNASIFPDYLNNLSSHRLQKMVEYASTASPFYQQKFKKTLEHHAQFIHYPISTKAEMMSHFDQLLTDKNVNLADIRQFISSPQNIGKAYRDRYFVWESSGTNGLQGIYIQDRSCISRYQAIEAIRKSSGSIFNQLAYQAFGKERIAYIGALDHHYASTVSLAILKEDFISLKKAIKDFSIFQSIEELIANLAEYDPSVIITYPSMAICLADHIHPALKPRELWLGGESLSTKQRSHIESSLQSKIYCSYGASEFLPIAWECAKGNLHVNSDWVLLEAVDEHFLPLPAGNRSYTTLLTNLANTIQPIIRYDLGDQICYSPKKCPCGSMLPHIKVFGRTSHYLKFIDIDGKEIKISALTIISLIEEHGIFNATISQVDNPAKKCDRCLYLEFIAGSHPTEKDFQKIQESIQQYLANNHIENVTILCTKIAHDRLGYSGKHGVFNERI